MNATSTSEVSSLAAFQAEVDAGVLDAVTAEGFVGEDGTVSRQAVADAIRERLMPTLARTSKERREKAIGRGTLIASLFKSTVGPGSPEWDPEDEVAVAVWARLVGMFGQLIAMGRRGKVQQMLKEDALVLLHHDVGDDNVPSVYVSDDRKLIVEDFVTPRKAKLQFTSEEVALDFNLVSDRLPNLRKVLVEKFDEAAKGANDGGRAKLALSAGDDGE